MEEKLRQAKAEVFHQGQAGWPEFTLARSLLDCARAMFDFPERQAGALLLLRDAADLAIRARLAHAGTLDDSPLTSREALWLAFASSEAGQEPFVELSEDERELVRQAVTEGDNKSLAALDPEQRQARTKALARFVPALVRELQAETQRVYHVRTMRAFRVGSTVTLLVAAVVAAWVMLAKALRGENLALGRPVTISSNFDLGRYPPEGIVDGITDTIGCHTQSEQRPWIQIDLGRLATIREVAVFNRGENLSDRAVPLVIEVSRDGKQYQVFDRHEPDFTVWKAGKQPLEGRFVRLTVQKAGFLHFNEVEVYGK